MRDPLWGSGAGAARLCASGSGVRSTFRSIAFSDVNTRKCFFATGAGPLLWGAAGQCASLCRHDRVVCARAEPGQAALPLHKLRYHRRLQTCASPAVPPSLRFLSVSSARRRPSICARPRVIRGALFRRRLPLSPTSTVHLRSFRLVFSCCVLVPTLRRPHLHILAAASHPCSAQTSCAHAGSSASGSATWLVRRLCLMPPLRAALSRLPLADLPALAQRQAIWAALCNDSFPPPPLFLVGSGRKQSDLRIHSWTCTLTWSWERVPGVKLLPCARRMHRHARFPALALLPRCLVVHACAEERGFCCCMYRPWAWPGRMRETMSHSLLCMQYIK